MPSSPHTSFTQTRIHTRLTHSSWFIRLLWVFGFVTYPPFLFRAIYFWNKRGRLSGRPVVLWNEWMSELADGRSCPPRHFCKNSRKELNSNWVFGGCVHPHGPWIYLLIVFSGNPYFLKLVWAAADLWQEVWPRSAPRAAEAPREGGGAPRGWALFMGPSEWQEEVLARDCHRCQSLKLLTSERPGGTIFPAKGWRLRSPHGVFSKW